jgi:hypothetical protein
MSFIQFTVDKNCYGKRAVGGALVLLLSNRRQFLIFDQFM